jgi:hypothetical protein
MSAYAEVIVLLREEIQQDKRAVAEKESALVVLERLEASRQARMPLMERAATVAIPSVLPTPRGKTFSEEVEAAVRSAPGEFAVPDVETMMTWAGTPVSGKHPRARLSAALSELAARGVIVRTFEGGGSVPHRYMLVSPSQADVSRQTETETANA